MMAQEVFGVEMPAARFTPDTSDAGWDQRHITKVTSDIRSGRWYFDEKAMVKEQNYNFYEGKQWTAAEIEAHERQYRRAMVFNEIQHKIDHLRGVQVQTRMDIKATAREISDVKAAELVTFLFKYSDQVNNMEQIESLVFRDGIVGGAGAVVTRWKMEDVNRGYAAIEPVPIQEICWDLDARKQDLSDARWMARVCDKRRVELIELFPEYEEQIMKAESTFYDGYRKGYVDAHRSNVKYNYSEEYSGDNSRDFLEFIEYYERVKIYEYVIIDDIGSKRYEFKEYKEAKAFYDGLCESYIEQGQNLLHPDRSKRIAMIKNSRDAMMQSLIVGDQLICYDLTDLPFFPWTVYFAYFHEGRWWAFEDCLIDPQVLVNRFFSQWDYQLGTGNKNITLVQETLLKRGFNIENLRDEMSRTNPVISILSPQAITVVPNQAVNPEYFQGIGFGIERMQDYAGGRNALGLQENAAESGRAVIARAEQGGLARLPLFDALRDWKLTVGQKVLWFIKNYMPSGQILRIIGDDKTVTYVDLDDGLLDTLKEIKVDLTVDEIRKADSIRDYQFQQMKEVFMTLPGLPPEMVTKILLEFSSVSETKKTEIMQTLQFYQQYMQQQAQLAHDQKLAKEAADSVQRKQIKDQLLRGEQLAEQTQEVEKERRNLAQKRDEMEELRIALQGASTPTEKNAAFSKANTSEEIGQLAGQSIMSALQG